MDVAAYFLARKSVMDVVWIGLFLAFIGFILGGSPWDRGHVKSLWEQRHPIFSFFAETLGAFLLFPLGAVALLGAYSIVCVLLFVFGFLGFEEGLAGVECWK